MKKIAVFIIKLFLRLFYIFPVKENMCCFLCYHGNSYGCNTKYLYRYLLENHISDYTFVWAFNNPDEFKDVLELSKAKVVKFKSIKYIYYAMTAKYRITNAEEWILLPKRRGQVYLNLWHGMPFKKIGLDANVVKNKLGGLDYYKDTDVFVSASTKNNDIFRTAFAYDGYICESGIPRNDFLINNRLNDSLRVELYKKIGLESGVNYCLYAPTFREVGEMEIEKINGSKVLEALTKRFGGKWKFLLRKHSATAYGIGREDFFEDINNDFVDVTNYPDMQELMLVSSVLITDYSSTIWDYSFLDKPIFSYAPDISKYEKSERGFYESPSKWGISICRNNCELVESIMIYDDVAFKKRMIQMLELFGSKEKGIAAEIIVKEVFSSGKTKKII